MQDAGSNGTVAAGSQCISLSLGNALFLAKFHVFATHTNFAKLAKFR